MTSTSDGGAKRISGTSPMLRKEFLQHGSGVLRRFARRRPSSASVPTRVAPAPVGGSGTGAATQSMPVGESLGTIAQRTPGATSAVEADAEPTSPAARNSARAREPMRRSAHSDGAKRVRLLPAPEE
jgi:hypothetical protein